MCIETYNSYSFYRFTNKKWEKKTTGIAESSDGEGAYERVMDAWGCLLFERTAEVA